MNTDIMALGVARYTAFVAISSPIKNGDNTPWELSASVLGGSALANGYSEESKVEAYRHYIRACIPIINIYNIFKYLFY